MAKSASRAKASSSKSKVAQVKPATAAPRASANNAFDVVVIGAHPSAYFAAAVIAHDAPKLRILHTTLPGEEHADRLQLVNTKLLAVHPILKSAATLASLPSARGLQFLSADAGVRGEFVASKPAALIAPTATLTAAMEELARKQSTSVEFVKPKGFTVARVVDDGVELALDNRNITTRVLIVATELPRDAAKILGISPERELGVMHRYSFMRARPLKGAITMPANGTIPMSLDLVGSGAWAWLLTAGDASTVQISVQQLARSTRAYPPDQLLRTWAEQLAAHGIVRAPEKTFAEPIHVADIPVAGALSAETVANRTLLIGPAGGFYSACGEDVYPSCWSAVAAADVVIKALKARHVQDELQSYREKWGSTLGDYLRGPQQNLTLLLPLIYKNAVMSARVAEAILFGESVVR